MLQNTMCEFISSLPKLGKRRAYAKGAQKKKLLISWEKMDGSIFSHCANFP